MKKFLSILICLGLGFSFVVRASDVEVEQLKKKAVAEIKKSILRAGNNAAISYMELDIPKYLAGGEVALLIGGTYSILKCSNEVDPVTGRNNRSCHEVKKEKIDPQLFKEEVITAAKDVFEIPFIYNLKMPIHGKVSPNGARVEGHVGIDREDPHDPHESEMLFDDIKIEKAFEGEHYTLNVNCVFSFAIYSFVRTKWETLKKVELASKEGREATGKVTFSRLGPGINQTDVHVEADIYDNESFSPIEHIITGDYLVKAKDVFCGCNYVLSEDQVVNTVSHGRIDTIRLKLPKLVKSTVSGRLVTHDRGGESKPVANQTLHLKPACEGADECMNKVEDVVTDEDGKFEFKDVPKGGYKIIYKDKYTLKEVLNCEAGATSMDVGELVVSVPYRYSIELIHKGGARSGLKLLHVKWPEIIIRPLGENVPLATLIANDDTPGEGRPVDTDGNPLTVPYIVKFPGYPQYDRTFYGENLKEELPEEIKISSSYGVSCHLEQAQDAPTGVYMSYADKPRDVMGYPTVIGHHMEFGLSVMCGGRNQLMFQFMTGHVMAEAPDHYSSLPKVEEDTLEHWRKCEDFEENYSNSAGGKLTLKFICLGPEELDTPPDDGACDDFEEDCGSDRNPPTDPPSGCDEFEEDCGNNNGGTNPPSDGGGLPPGMGDVIGGIADAIGGLFGN